VAPKDYKPDKTNKTTLFQASPQVDEAIFHDGQFSAITSTSPGNMRRLFRHIYLLMFEGL